MTELRLISFLPAATEMAFALGLGDRLVGVSNECDFSVAAKTKPVVVKPSLRLAKMSLRELYLLVNQSAGICEQCRLARLFQHINMQCFGKRFGLQL
jgi:hypothetical protein